MENADVIELDGVKLSENEIEVDKVTLTFDPTSFIVLVLCLVAVYAMYRFRFRTRNKGMEKQ